MFVVTRQLRILKYEFRETHSQRQDRLSKQQQH